MVIEELLKTIESFVSRCFNSYTSLDAHAELDKMKCFLAIYIYIIYICMYSH